MIERYKTNKSPLKKFLEKKSEKSVAKPYVGKSDTYFTKLLKIAETADIEDLARLKACGCNIEGNLLLTVRDFPAVILSKYLRMKEHEDENNRMMSLYILSGGLFWYYTPVSYLVAGVEYKDREEFLLKSTALGRALI
jgi:hypothetical protein